MQDEPFPSLAQHLEWCQEQLENDRRSLELFLTGQMTLRCNGHDVSSAEVQRLTRSIRHLETQLITLT